MNSYIERRKRFGNWYSNWYIVYPADEGEGMGVESGPYLTRVGARFARWLWR